MDDLILFASDPSKGEAEVLALSGACIYIAIKLFDEVDHDRKVTGEGKSIMRINAKGNMTFALIFNEDTSQDCTVPAEHKVRAIGATVGFTEVAI